MKPAVIILLCLAVVAGAPVMGQTSQVKDRLKLELKNARSVTQRVDALNNLAWEYFDFDDSVAVGYAQQAFRLADQSGYLSGKKFAYTLLGIGDDAYGNYEKAVHHFQLSDQIQEGTLDRSVYNLTLWGNMLTNLGRYDSAAVVFDQAMKIATQYNLSGRLSNLYNSYARLYAQTWENRKALDYLNLGQNIRKDTTVHSQIDFLATYVRVYINLLDFEKATQYAEKLCASTSGIDDNFHMGMCYLYQAELDYSQGHYREALSHCFQALAAPKIFNYHFQRAQLYFRIGKIYRRLSEYDLAQSFYFKALAITEKSGLEPLNADLYNEIGWNYKDLGNFDIALQYIDRALAIFTRLHDRKGEADSYGSRAVVFYTQKKYEESIKNHEKAFALRKEIDFTEGMAATVFNLALNYEAMGDYSRALKLQRESLEIKRKIVDKASISNSYFGIAHVLMQQGKLSEAEHYLDTAVQVARVTNSKIIKRKGYQYYAELYEKKADYQHAMEYRKKYESINDSIFSENITSKVADMQGLYQVERKEKEIELLNSQKALSENRISLQESQIKAQMTVIIIGSVLFIIAAIFGFYVFRLNRQLVMARQEQAQLNDQLNQHALELRETNDSLSELNQKLSEKQEEIMAQSEELAESNTALIELNNDIRDKQKEISNQAAELKVANDAITQMNKTLEEKVAERTSQLRQAYLELDTFFYRSSHDFRRPLTTFMGLSEVAKVTVKDQKAIELFEKVNETAIGLDKMLKKLQSISDLGSQELVYKEVSIRELIANILVGFQDEIERRQIKITEDFAHNKSFYSYPALVRVIVENLLENAIQFSAPESAYIKIETCAEDDNIVIRVEDNGQGIADEFRGRIFDMYFRANASSKGNGLGLYIANKAAIRLNGSIAFETTVNVGSVFTVKLPLNNYSPLS